jgi:hypothetical protein
LCLELTTKQTSLCQHSIHQSNSGHINLWLFGKSDFRGINPCDSFSNVAASITSLSIGISLFCHIDTAGTETPTSLDTLVHPPKSLIIAVAFIQVS